MSHRAAEREARHKEQQVIWGALEEKILGKAFKQEQGRHWPFLEKSYDVMIVDDVVDLECAKARFDAAYHARWAPTLNPMWLHFEDRRRRVDQLLLLCPA